MQSKFIKSLLWLLALLVLAYVGVCAYLYVQQRQMLFQPEDTRVRAEQTNFTLQRPDATLRGWQLHPAQASAEAPRNAVIYFGGNAESIEHRLHDLQHALPGSDIYMLAYRGYGASDGEPTQALLEADAVALFDEVRRMHPLASITVIGRSLGTGVAAAVADVRKPEKLVLVTPFDSILNTVRGMYEWLPVSLLLHDRFDSAAHLQNYSGPLLVLRAGRDREVVPARTDALLAELKNKAVTVLAFEKANHSTILHAPGFWNAVQSFVGNV